MGFGGAREDPRSGRALRAYADTGRLEEVVALFFEDGLPHIDDRASGPGDTKRIRGQRPEAPALVCKYPVPAILRVVDYSSSMAPVLMLSCLRPLPTQKPAAVPTDCVVTIVATDVAPPLPPWKPPATDGATPTKLAVPTTNWPYWAAGCVGDVNIPPTAAPVGSVSVLVFWASPPPVPPVPVSVAPQLNVIVPVPVVGPARAVQLVVVELSVPLNFDFPSGNTRLGGEGRVQPRRVPEMLIVAGVLGDPGMRSGGVTLMIPLVTVVQMTVSCELSTGATPAVAAGTNANHPASGTAAAIADMTIFCL